MCLKIHLFLSLNSPKMLALLRHAFSERTSTSLFLISQVSAVYCSSHNKEILKALYCWSYFHTRLFTHLFNRQGQTTELNSFYYTIVIVLNELLYTPLFTICPVGLCIYHQEYLLFLLLIICSTGFFKCCTRFPILLRRHMSEQRNANISMLL